MFSIIRDSDSGESGFEYGERILLSTIMAAPPNPPRVFHITAIPNLARIAQSGELLCKSRLQALQRQHDNIAYENIQNRRSRTVVPVGPGGVLHDYVPFHFAPRQPMLNAIQRGIVPGCAHGQQDIVHLMLRADRIDAAGLPYVFATHHAVTAIADFYDSLADLDKIDWDMFFDPPLTGEFSKYFHNPVDRPEYATRKESRQAEFLVHGAVPVDQVVGIGVLSDAKRQEVEAILAACNWQVPVRVKRDWYF
jgi:hypothetical protein